MAEGNRAPSLILYYHEECPADIVIQEVNVPKEGSAQCTYYCCICWNPGKNGSGYCGIQDHPDGKCYIFSIWDPQNTSEPINAVYKGPGTWTERFGGEGTGLKSMNFELGWQPDRWYTNVIRRWDHQDHTRFGFWVQDQTSGTWTHLVTMDFPEPGYYFEDVSSFLEDWHGNGHSVRCVNYRNGLKRKQDHSSWCPLKSATFFANQEDACKTYNNNFNACATSGCYFLQSGHTTCPEQGLGTSQELTCGCADEDTALSSPEQPFISFSIETVSISGLSWSLDQQATPQFSYTIKDGDKTLVSEVDSETRSHQVDLVGVSEITLILEDILGREASVTMEISAKTCQLQHSI